MNKLFLSHVAEQTIYFPLFAEQSFLSQTNIASLQESNGPPLTATIKYECRYHFCKLTHTYVYQLHIRFNPSPPPHEYQMVRPLIYSLGYLHFRCANLYKKPFKLY